MAPKVDKELVSRLVELTGLDKGSAEDLVKVGQVVRIPEGWSIIMETTPADKAYIVLEGEVEVRKSGEKVASLGPGEVIGEIALLDHKLRSASVVAATPIKALHFTDEVIRDLVKDVPAFSELFTSAAKGRS